MGHMTHGVISKVQKLLPTHKTKGNDFIQFFKNLVKWYLLSQCNGMKNFMKEHSQFRTTPLSRDYRQEVMLFIK